MTIRVNEQQQDLLPGDTLGTLRDRLKPDADLLIVNGFPAEPDAVLQHGDQVVLIQRGEIPRADEFEALLTARHTPGVHQRIKHARIGVAGVGGLGSSVAIALARIGIGQLILADFDVVEPSNLNRQQYFIDQIGQPKVYALRSTLARINPHVHVTACHVRITPKNVGDIFGHASILVEGFDRADQKAMLVESFATRFPDRPVIAASGLAGAEPANTVLTRQIAKHVYLCGDGLTAAAPGVGLMAPRVGVAAHHQANAVLRLLLGKHPADGDPE